MMPPFTAGAFSLEPIIIPVPISVPMGNKRYYLNLNVYRNTHHHVLNKAKVLFEQIVMPSLMGLPRLRKLNLTYTLFPGSNRDLDTANVCCIVDKFFSDTLKNSGKIPDDNHRIIIGVSYRYGSVDTKNPRIEVSIHDYEIEPMKEDPMRIILVQAEIEEAVKAYVLNQIQVKDDQDISIDFKNTRGEDGATAEINIGPAQAPVTSNTPATQKPAQVRKPAPAPLAPPQVPTQAPQTPVAQDPVREQSIGEEPEVQAVEETAPEAPQTPAPETPVTTATLKTPVEEGAPPVAPAVKSLFAGLPRPVNS